MKTVCKKLLSIMLVAILLVSAVPFAASADEVSTVSIDIYEVDLENNAVLKGTVTGVNPAGYASQDDMVKDVYDGQWTKYQYRDMGDGTAILRVWPLETPDEKQVYTLTVVFNTGRPMEEDKISFNVYEGDNILEAMKEYGVKVPTYADHKFVGWSFTHSADASADVVTIYSVIEGNTTIWADWEEISDDDEDEEEVVYDAVLKIYTNGNTGSAAKTVDLDIYSIDGKITRSEVEAAVQKNYKAANSNGMSFYGLFTSSNSIANYKTATGVTSVDLDADKTTTIYVMVTNATAITNNTNNEPADPTNPKTGDMIGVSLALMMSTGGAALMLGKKRKF